MTKMVARWVLIGVPAVVIAGCDETAAVTCEPVLGGDRAVMARDPAGNSAAAAPRLVEIWRASGPESPELAMPVMMAVSAGGRAAIPDFQLGEVILVERGEPAASIAPRGAGPGEIQLPLATVWGEAGELVIFDVVGSRILLVDGRGEASTTPVDPEFSTSIVASGQVLWTGLSADGTIYSLQRSSRRAGDGPVERLLALRSGARAADTIASLAVETLPDPFGSLVVPGSRRLRAAVSGDGSLAIGGLAHDDRILVRRAGGGSVEICLDREPAPLSPAERGDRGQMDDEEWAGLAAAIRSASRIERPGLYGRMFFATDGKLWVQRDRADPANSLDELYGPAGGTFDVYLADGELWATVAAPPAARIQAATASEAWAFEFTADGVPMVVALSVPAAG